MRRKRDLETDTNRKKVTLGQGQSVSDTVTRMEHQTLLATTGSRKDDPRAF
jgi:hypothetical protein